MPGYEIFGKEELVAIEEIFTQSNGVIFAHGFHDRRKGIYRVRDFEKTIAEKLHSKYALAVSSGTSAGYVALKALGVGPGDEVITQAFTFVATVEDILLCGATPVVVDVDETLNMCPKALESAITDKTKAIVPVHMLGNPARMDEILAIARRHKIAVAEDACESLGATYKGKAVGTLGDIGFFSLDFGKSITTGEGGLVLTDNESLSKTAFYLHDHGHGSEPHKGRAEEIPVQFGFNFRMTELQAAVGIAQLKKLDYILQTNRKNKLQLKEKLSQLGNRIQFRTLTDTQGDLADTVIFFLPTVKQALGTVSLLKQVGVGTKNLPDALNWHFAGRWSHLFKNPETQWLKSKELLERSIALPVSLLSTQQEIDLLAEKVISAVLKNT